MKRCVWHTGQGQVLEWEPRFHCDATGPTGDIYHPRLPLLSPPEIYSWRVFVLTTGRVKRKFLSPPWRRNIQTICRQLIREMKHGRPTQEGGGGSWQHEDIPCFISSSLGRWLDLCFNDMHLGFKYRSFSVCVSATLATSWAALQLCRCKFKCLYVGLGDWC